MAVGGTRPSASPPFVGRATELAIVTGHATEAWNGNPRIVMVEADAGLGKSTLLNEAVSELGPWQILRAACDEAEMNVAYGVLDQLVRAAPPAALDGLHLLGSILGSDLDPAAIGAELVNLLSNLQGDDRPAAVIVDDLHWCDSKSAQALLFAFRRLHQDRVLLLVTARPTELARLGGSWSSSISGDHRSARLWLEGLQPCEVAALASGMGVTLTGAAAARLTTHTGGSPLHCRALLEELSVDVLNRIEEELPVPRAHAAIVLLRVSVLPRPAQDLIAAASILGLRSPTVLAAEVAELADPVEALDALIEAGLMVEEVRAGHPRIAFAHSLMQQAVYADLNASKRRALHARAAALTEGAEQLTHRATAASGPDAELANDLEAAAWQLVDRHRLAESAVMFGKAAELSTDPRERARRLIDALAEGMDSADFALADSYFARVEALPPSATRSLVLGNYAMLQGNFARMEELVAAAWADNWDDEPMDRSGWAAGSMGIMTFVVGRADDGVLWGERAVNNPALQPGMRQHAKNFLAANLAAAGRGDEAIGVFAEHAEEPSGLTAINVAQTHVFRGIVRLFVDDLDGALRDLTTSRAFYRSGQSFNYDTHGLTFLVDAAFRAGAWDEAAVHADFAVSVAHDADHVWDFGFVHAHAALVPACRGDWEAAEAHIAEAAAWAEGIGIDLAIAMIGTARSYLKAAQQDWDGVLAAAEAVRVRGRTDALGRPGLHSWRALEVEAFIALDRLDEAATALDEFAAAIPSGGHRTSELSVLRLRGQLAHARGNNTEADAAFAAAHELAASVPSPFEIAKLDLADGQRTGSRALLDAARTRFAALGADPFVQLCGAAGAATVANGPTSGLTPTEVVVARLVSGGRTNQEVATELFVSVKAIEYHLTNIYGKLGIRSRRELASVLGGESVGFLSA